MILFATQAICSEYFNEQVTCVSSYLYHGKMYGGLSIQPEIDFNYNGIFAEVWMNIGAADYTFRSPMDEVDVIAGYKNYGLEAVYKHMFVYDFTESVGYAELGYNFGVLTNCKFFINDITKVYGGRIGESYLLARYTIDLPYAISIQPEIGFLIYTNTFQWQSAECTFNKSWNVHEHTIVLFDHVMYNPTYNKLYNAVGLTFKY